MANSTLENASFQRKQKELCQLPKQCRLAQNQNTNFSLGQVILQLVSLSHPSHAYYLVSHPPPSPPQHSSRNPTKSSPLPYYLCCCCCCRQSPPRVVIVGGSDGGFEDGLFLDLIDNLVSSGSEVSTGGSFR